MIDGVWLVFTRLEPLRLCIPLRNWQRRQPARLISRTWLSFRRGSIKEWMLIKHTEQAATTDMDSLASKAHKRGAPCPQDESSRKPYLKSPLVAGVSVNCDTARQKSSSLRTMWDNADNCDLLKQEIGLERMPSRTSALLGLFADFRPQFPGISQSHIHRLRLISLGAVGS